MLEKLFRMPEHPYCGILKYFSGIKICNIFFIILLVVDADDYGDVADADIVDEGK